VHFHTDHSWFAGCETMLVNLLSSAEVREAVDVSLSYRYSDRYAAELRERIVLDFPVYPLGFRDPSELFIRGRRSASPLHRAGRAVSRGVTTVPLLAHETVVLGKLFRRIQPDILHINNGGFPGALSARAAAIAGRRAKVPRVLMVVNNFAEGYTTVGRLLQLPLDHAVIESTDLFVVGSRASGARLSSVLSLSSSRVAAVPNGADLRRPTETRTETRARLGLSGFHGVVFGIVALMERRKGHRVLLEALDQLAVQDRVSPDALRLVLLGDGGLRPILEQYVRERGLTAYCHFLGEEGNAMNVIATLDVLVLSSVASEDFPNVVLEGMGMGKPVIASRIAGTPEQLEDGATGILVPPGDARSMAAAMLRLLSDPALRVLMGAAGRARYEARFTAQAAAARYTRVYEVLLGRGRGRDFWPGSDGRGRAGA